MNYSKTILLLALSISYQNYCAQKETTSLSLELLKELSPQPGKEVSNSNAQRVSNLIRCGAKPDKGHLLFALAYCSDEVLQIIQAAASEAVAYFEEVD